MAAALVDCGAVAETLWKPCFHDFNGVPVGLLETLDPPSVFMGFQRFP